MTRLIAWAAAIWVVLAASVSAQPAGKPLIVVELYTSQGCSSCPPADAFLHKLAKRADVVALSMHVDYWDYIGWKDVFADHKFTLRQHGYARAGQRRSVYTPQMIIHGQDHVVGNHPMDVSEIIKRYQARTQSIVLKASREGGQVMIRASGGQGAGPMVVQLVQYEPEVKVDIRRGENAGKTISYANVVREWQVIGEWNGAKPVALSAKAAGKLPMAVIVQQKGFGPIVAAARVE
ncbi:DUF1223 domain-containing protein [Rhodobacteraceae bacterium D3-12]|nr:DUF1223 domain-containing protein [Rhodobacteraceae bacterium D3-12]